MRHVSKLPVLSYRFTSSSVITETILTLQLSLCHVQKSQRLHIRYQSTLASRMSGTTSEPTGSGDNQHIQPGSSTEVNSQRQVDKPEHLRKQKGLPKKRDTHFLCFPLVTDTSIPQLAKALEYFREVTTKSRQDGQDKGRKDKQGGSKNNVEDTPNSVLIDADADAESSNDLEPNVNEQASLPSVNTSLQILPPITHRPPGTFHLTLGVMDLSTTEEMQRALDLLQKLDYADIFHTVKSQLDGSTSRHQQIQHGDDLVQEEKASGVSAVFGAQISTLTRPISPPSSHSRSATQQTEFSKDSPLQISLTGISTFPSPKSSRVFYAKPSPSSSMPFPLLQFGQAIRKIFREEGFITETRPLVLHATVANMRYAVQARGGRTSKGKNWRYGKDRWKDGEVDAREIIKVFNTYEGNLDEYLKGSARTDGDAREFVWAEDINLNRVAICKMGAEKSDDEVLGMVYPPVGEKLIFS